MTAGDLRLSNGDMAEPISAGDPTEAVAVGLLSS